MAVIVGIPREKTRVTNQPVVAGTVEELYIDRDTLQILGPKRTKRASYYTIAGNGHVDRASGPKQPLGNGFWLPCRPYSRSSIVTLPLSGELICGSPTEISSGYINRYTNSTPPWMSSQITHVDKASTIKSSCAYPVMSQNMANRLMTEVLVKVSRRQVDLGAMFGESHKTLHHLTETVTTAVRVLLAIRKGNWKQAAKHLKLDWRHPGKTFASRWLELQYGWKPLVSDIYDTARAFQHGLDHRTHVLRAIRRITDSTTISSSAGTADVTTITKQEWSYRCVAYFRPKDSWINSMSQIGLANPAEIAWELLPYSFVVDWFLPIGNLLQAATARCSITFIDGCLSTRLDENGVITINGPLDPSYIVLQKPLRGGFAASGYNRTKMTLLLPLPYIKSPFSSTHLISALALLRQLKR